MKVSPNNGFNFYRHFHTKSPSPSLFRCHPFLGGTPDEDGSQEREEYFIKKLLVQCQAPVLCDRANVLLLILLIRGNGSSRDRRRRLHLSSWHEHLADNLGDARHQKVNQAEVRSKNKIYGCGTKTARARARATATRTGVYLQLNDSLTDGRGKVAS